MAYVTPCVAPMVENDREGDNRIDGNHLTYMNMKSASNRDSLSLVVRSLMRLANVSGIKKRRTNRWWFAAFEMNAFIRHFRKHSGSLACAKLCKCIYGFAKKKLLHCPPITLTEAYRSYPIWLSLNRAHLPKRLRAVNLLLRSEHSLDREVGFIILHSFTVIEHRPVYSRSPRLDVIPHQVPANFSGTFEIMCSLFRLDRLRIRRFNRIQEMLVFISTSGPYGPCSVKKSGLDAWALLQPKYSTILAAVKQFVGLYKDREGGTFVEAFQTLLEANASTVVTPPKEGPRVARFIVLSEGGSKSRGVTPVNYWIQVALRPCHEVFMERLRFLEPMDCTFSESEGLDWMMAMTKRKERLFCYDWSDATDRFPRTALRVIFSKFHPELADAYLRLMAIPIVFGSTEKSEFPFGTGAPMGIYCLWPVFALAHHCMVQLAARNCGLSLPYKHYRLRGDDVCLIGDNVAREYVLLCKQLGVKISESKSFFASRDGEGRGEFAKRLFFRGRMVNMFQFKELVSCVTLDPWKILDIMPRYLFYTELGQSEALNKVPLETLLSTFLPRKGSGVTLKSLMRYVSTRFMDKSKFWTYIDQTTASSEANKERYDEGVAKTFHNLRDIAFSALLASDLTVKVDREERLLKGSLPLSYNILLPGKGSTPRAVMTGGAVLDSSPALLRAGHYIEELTKLSRVQTLRFDSMQSYPFTKVLLELLSVNGISQTLRDANRSTLKRRFLSKYVDFDDKLNWYVYWNLFPGFCQPIRAPAFLWRDNLIPLQRSYIKIGPDVVMRQSHTMLMPGEYLDFPSPDPPPLFWGWIRR